MEFLAVVAEGLLHLRKRFDLEGGMKRLAIVLGIGGGIIGASYGYAVASDTWQRRSNSQKFEALSSSPVLSGIALAMPSNIYGIGAIKLDAERRVHQYALGSHLRLAISFRASNRRLESIQVANGNWISRDNPEFAVLMSQPDDIDSFLHYAILAIPLNKDGIKAIRLNGKGGADSVQLSTDIWIFAKDDGFGTIMKSPALVADGGLPVPENTYGVKAIRFNKDSDYSYDFDNYYDVQLASGEWISRSKDTFSPSPGSMDSDPHSLVPYLISSAGGLKLPENADGIDSIRLDGDGSVVSIQLADGETTSRVDSAPALYYFSLIIFPFFGIVLPGLIIFVVTWLLRGFFPKPLSDK
jgi:hypothetical protein